MTIKVNHSQMEEVLNIAYERKVSTFTWGTMGIGKSDTIRNVAFEIAKKLGMPVIEGEPDGEDKFGFIDVRISQFEPSDLRGLPIADLQKDFTKWLVANWLPRNAKSKGILFFDELNLAPPSIQASAYQLILNRRLLDYKLPDGWVIFSAGNTIDDRANVFELPAPLANRFVHIELSVPSKDEWVAWALKNNIDMSLISFLEFKPSLLFKFDKKMKDKSFPTPRSWALCSNLIKDNKVDEEILHILVSSAVGEGCATEFIAYNKLQKKIDIKKILDKPEMVKDITELDLQHALLGCITEKYRSDKKILEKAIKVCDYLQTEFAILLLRYLKGTSNDFQTEVIKLASWKPLAQKYAKYLLDLKGD